MTARRLITGAAVLAVLVLSAAVAPPAASQSVATTSEAVASQHHTDSDFQTAAALTNTTIEGSGDTASVGLSGESRQVIDDFEDGDLSEYSITDDGPDGAPPTVTSSQSYSGSYSLELTAEGGSSNNGGIESSSGLNYYPEPGDSVDVYVKTDDASEGGQYFKFGTNSSHQITVGYQGNDGYIEIISPNDGVQTSTSLNADEWYRFHVEWASDGGVVFEVYDSTDSQVAAVSLASSDVTSGGYVGFRRWSGSGTVHSWFDYAYRKSTQPDAGSYLSANHSVSQPTRAWANLTLDNASATVEWQGWTGSSWTVVNSSTYSTSGNKTLDVSGYDSWRVNVSFNAQSGSTTAKLHDEGLLFDASTPIVDNRSASPSGESTVTSDPVTLALDVSDEDFDTAQGDELSVTFYVTNNSTSDYHVVGDATLTSNGTAEASFSPIYGGDHTWYAVITDEYNNQIQSESFSFKAPATLEIRQANNPDQLVNDTSVEIRFFSGDTIVKRTVEDGRLLLSGLPTGREFVVVADGNGYYQRRIHLTSLFDQSTIYLLNSSKSGYYTEFVLEDLSGRFEPSSTRLVIERSINTSNNDNVSWEVIAGDYFGAANAFKVTLDAGVRYRLRLVADDGSVRVVGPYMALDEANPKLIRVGSIKFKKPNATSYMANASANTIDDTTYINFSYRDVNCTTTDFSVEVYKLSNPENVTYTDSLSGPICNYSASVAVPADSGPWVVNYTGTRNGERISGLARPGEFESVGLPLGDPWKGTISMIFVLGVATLAGTVDASRVTVGVVAVAGLLMAFDLAPIHPALWWVALLIAVGGFLRNRGGAAR